MEKEQNSKIEEKISDKPTDSEEILNDKKSKEEKVDLKPEDKILTPEDKIIAYDSLEYYEGKQLAIARGRAMAIRGERRVRADILRAHFGAENKKRNSSKIERIEADGNVHLSTESEIVTADRGDYKINDGLATVSGAVKITRGKTQLNGDHAEVNLNTGRSRLLTSKPGSNNPNKRVRGIIMPSALKTNK